MRELKWALDGARVVQTTSRLDGDGKLEGEDTVVLGERDGVLDHLEGEVSKAAAERDGMAAATDGKKEPPKTGKPGESASYYTLGKDVYKCVARYDGAGRFASCRVERMGGKSDRLAWANERLAELTQMRNGVRDAQ